MTQALQIEAPVAPALRPAKRRNRSPSTPLRISPANCSHVPLPNSAREEAGIYRTTCRYCECDLVRTLVSRKWYRSGLFGS
jgi:hypothetical protein